MKVYTRRGDAGETDLFGGERVAKDTVCVEAYGAVDELNSVLGMAAAASASADVALLVQLIQSALFALGAYLATPAADRSEKREAHAPGGEEIAELEAHIDAFEEELEPLRSFVLPGGTEAAAAFHVARTVCRRAERRVVTLGREEELAPEAPGYLNRLSDLLFVMARLENRRAGAPDVPWVGRRG